MTGPASFRLLLALAFGSVCASPMLAQDPTAPGGVRSGIVEGFVRGRFQGELRPLPYAIVELVSAGIRRSTLADDSGRYRLDAIPPGDARVAVSYTGYRPLTVIVSVPDRGSVGLDFELSGSPVLLPSIDVRADGDPAGPSSIGVGGGEDPIPEVELEALDLGPGVSKAGLLGVVSALPGNDPADPTDVLFMRGSTTDLKLVLLDGVPVYTPFHVAGLMRSFEPGVLGSADLHVGGAPARFDGGLTHILELRTRAPRRDRVRVSSSIDLISAAAAVEAPLGDRAGFILSGRTLHGLGGASLGQRPYGYRDLLLTVSAEPAPGQELRTTGFWNEESVALDPSRVPNDARWANRAGSVTYGTSLGRAHLELTAGASVYRAELPLQPTRPPGAPPPPVQVATAATERTRLVGEVTWGPPAHPIRAGLSVDRVDVGLAAEELGGGSRAYSGGSAGSLGVFLDVARPLASGLTLRAGLRADHFHGSATYLGPRAALTWELSPEALLTIAAGRYHQPARTPYVEVERTLAEISAEGDPPGELLPVATADHFVLSLQQRLRGSVRLGLQGYWKGFYGLSTVADGIVRSSGVDLRVLSVGEVGTAWLGYGLSWFWSAADLTGRTSEFVGRHLLSAGASRRLAGPLRGEVRVAYGAGLPYTSVPFGSGDELGTPGLSTTSGGGPSSDHELAPLADGLDRAFLRVDLELQTLFEPRWGGRPWQLRPYLRVLNALDRRDALFYTFQPWRSESVRPLAEFPLFPIVGVSVSF